MEEREGAEWSRYLAHYADHKTFSESDTSAHMGHFQSVCLNRSSAVANKCSQQFSFYRILSDHYFTALLPPAHSNGSDTLLLEHDGVMTVLLACSCARESVENKLQRGQREMFEVGCRL